MSAPATDGAAAAAPATGEPHGAARHGVAVPRGQTLIAATKSGRFGRMFGSLPARDPGDDATAALFSLLEDRSTRPGNDLEKLPSGYTYLAQFVDHDITFDPTSILGRANDPHALRNFRTPRYDLDSLYGSGPKDQPFLYDWDFEPGGVKLLVGHNCNVPGLKPEQQPEPVDLPRNRQGRALIGDARNDENLIVSQLHLLFIHFHNAVVDCLCERRSDLEDGALFQEAQRIVRWHYQWIVVHDLLRRLVGETMACSVLKPPAAPGKPPAIAREFYRWEDEPAIPVEFSAAAFRCGHTMVRRTYAPKIAGGNVPILPDGTGRENFGGLRPLPSAVRIDWERFFPIDEHVQTNSSMAFDFRITARLFSLPPDGKQALPWLNLQRGRALELPAGRDVAHAMGVEPLTKEQLLLDDPLVAQHEETLLRATPLWYYILCEARARSQGLCLGPVGGRIVAEVLVGLLEADPQSYLRQWPAWTPTEEAQVLALEVTAEERAKGKEPGIFTMADLVTFARPAPEGGASP